MCYGNITDAVEDHNLANMIYSMLGAEVFASD